MISSNSVRFTSIQYRPIAFKIIQSECYYATFVKQTIIGLYPDNNYTIKTIFFDMGRLINKLRIGLYMIKPKMTWALVIISQHLHSQNNYDSSFFVVAVFV